ncbi:energy transducer TonB [Flavobacteriaceae bacterium]|nr:energy transducer TonB [Flavobacteriaceae bacterium]MDB2340174.1 energy transducer TonB [Flavobacteriaceae bacterium]
METKKNPKVDLNKDSSLYFVIGLVLTLLVSWQAIEWRTYDKDLYGYEALNVVKEDIEIVDNEKEVVETVIASSEMNKDEIIETVEVIDDFEDLDIPFEIIEDVPVFPGCEKVDKSQRRNCFQEKMRKHIRKNFRYPEIAQKLGIQGRVYVSFVISKDGQIINIKMRGPDKNLEKEAERIISKLPKMIPGKQRGQLVRVPFSIPIVFILQ